MTSEEAIRDLADTLQEAHSVALSTLRAFRAQKTTSKLDRSRWEECPDCWVWEGHHKFCADCGKPLTEEAWAELERRIGGNNENP